MIPANNTFIILLSALWITLMACEPRQKQEKPTTFTHIDSLTECYLAMHDSLLTTWNVMIQDDNRKLKMMANLLHELEVTGDVGPEEARSINKRIEQLHGIRFTPKTMWNSDVISEYDFACSSLVSELISKAEAIPSFSYNSTMQALVEEIRAAELRVENYRAEYDEMAARFNGFLDEHNEKLSEITDNHTAQKKALFQATSEN
jgi:hypothetical protein